MPIFTDTAAPTISQYSTLYPGDVVWLGAEGATPNMRPGDVVENDAAFVFIEIRIVEVSAACGVKMAVGKGQADGTIGTAFDILG